LVLVGGSGGGERLRPGAQLYVDTSSARLSALLAFIVAGAPKKTKTLALNKNYPYAVGAVDWSRGVEETIQNLEVESR